MIKDLKHMAINQPVIFVLTRRHLRRRDPFSQERIDFKRFRYAIETEQIKIAIPPSTHPAMAPILIVASIFPMVLFFMVPFVPGVVVVFKTIQTYLV
jgi:hypothetical protein